MSENSLDQEARDFNKINAERNANISSLEINDESVNSYFYKNPWRYKFSREYAFGSILKELESLLDTNSSLNILEIGCGNGWLSLNANKTNQHCWDCFDISEEGIRMANKQKEKFKLTNNNYFVNSLEEFSSEKTYDLVVCVNSLHHITNLSVFNKKVKEHLAKNGSIFISDVSSDYFDESNAAFVLILRLLLDFNKDIRFFEKLDTKDLDSLLEQIKNEWVNESDDKKQSINDHSHSTDEILSFLRNSFKEKYYNEFSGILMRLLGGLRGDSEDIQALSALLIKFEDLLLKKELIKPYSYTFIGSI